MRSPSQAAFHSQHLFLTAKSQAAIPVADPITHDALRQAALDPSVTAIEYVGNVFVGGANYFLDAIVVVRDGARYVLDIYDGKPVRSMDEEGLRLLAIDKTGCVPLPLPRGRILREPQCSNARLIWEHHRHPVKMSVRARVLEALENGGAMSIRELGVRREDVFALACDAAIDIDLNGDPIDVAAVRRSNRSTSARLSPFVR